MLRINVFDRTTRAAWKLRLQRATVSQTSLVRSTLEIKNAHIAVEEFLLILRRGKGEQE